VFTLRDDEAPISWKTKKQPAVALPFCETEYMALSETTKDLIYLRFFCMQIDAP